MPNRHRKQQHNPVNRRRGGRHPAMSVQANAPQSEHQVSAIAAVAQQEQASAIAAVEPPENAIDLVGSQVSAIASEPQASESDLVQQQKAIERDIADKRAAAERRRREVQNRQKEEERKREPNIGDILDLVHLFPNNLQEAKEGEVEILMDQLSLLIAQPEYKAMVNNINSLGRILAVLPSYAVSRFLECLGKTQVQNMIKDGLDLAYLFRQLWIVHQSDEDPYRFTAVHRLFSFLGRDFMLQRITTANHLSNLLWSAAPDFMFNHEQARYCILGLLELNTNTMKQIALNSNFSSIPALRMYLKFSLFKNDEYKHRVDTLGNDDKNPAASYSSPSPM